MTLEGKANAILPWLRTISRHDDAPVEMVRAALASVRRQLDAEEADLEAGRAERARIRDQREAERRAARDAVIAKG